MDKRRKTLKKGRIVAGGIAAILAAAVHVCGLDFYYMCVVTSWLWYFSIGLFWMGIFAKKWSTLKKAVISGMVATAVAGIESYIVNWYEIINFPAEYIRFQLIVIFVMEIFSGVTLIMCLYLPNIYRLIGCVTFGAGFGGLTINKIINSLVLCNVSQFYILACEIFCFTILFFVSGVMYAQQVNNE